MELFNCSFSVRTPSILLFAPGIRVSQSPKTIHTRNWKVRVQSQSQPGISDFQRKIRVSEKLRKETERTLEWQEICARISAFASTGIGRAVCVNGGLPFGRDRKESQRLLDQTTAAMELPRPLDFTGIEDVSAILSASVSGELLTVRELCVIERTLRAVRGVYEQLEEISSLSGVPDRYSPLLEILQDCNFLMSLAQKIGFCINCRLLVIVDQASKKLETIRKERRKNVDNLESLLKGVSAMIVEAGGIDRPLITKRRSRMCVGLRASHKSLLPDGVILDVSSSGATYFMEPSDAMELNNMDVRLSKAEKAEEFVILSMLTSEIAESQSEIRHLMDRILELDLAVTRGAYATSLNGVCPLFSEDGEKAKGHQLAVDIEGIQHPLLLESSRRNLPSVPLDIRIEHSTRVVVISGPNTGGKTATMKTLGLASLMSKAGLYLPAKNCPRLPWFDQILADIGDHQSLEHNLSTFSGHITRLCKILEVVTDESLILIDEIGNGTDPSEGIALSISILRYIASRVNLAVVTTHYSDLSCLKTTDSRFENAAMDFCIETLQPTYRILWGSTGNSNALSIARTIGFDHKVLNRAQEWVERLIPDKLKERQGQLYQSLMKEKNVLEAQAEKAASVSSEIMKIYQEIHSEAEGLEKREAALKVKASLLVQRELRDVKYQMDAVVKRFQNQLNRSNDDQLTSLLRESEAAIVSIVAAHTSEDESLTNDADGSNLYTPKIGDLVHVQGLGDKLATVVEAPLDNGTVLVQYGKIRIRVKIKDLKAIQSSMDASQIGAAQQPSDVTQKQDQKRNRPPPEANKQEDAVFGPVVQTSKNTVDLRGMRVEEASHRLNVALSACRPYGVLFIIHGMGTGAVKESTLKILAKHPRVAKFEQGSPMNYGCTAAYIK
ncbi:DNA mismatch repair protein MSH7 [Acorus gramineus]|uniref:DNA mismatch repair protein MSH7 n=1 Tax=Acorus gramineus TaxID=55184 RepID=A0AAV9A9C8_ACOGR|nr:DNA mismatch repair protein MSH7 [Acorus gramineus]